MNKIYHQRFTLASKSFITIITLLAVYLFWFRNAVHAILGLAVVIILVCLIERIIHTTYTLTSEGDLVIDRGRFARRTSIPVNEIVKVRQLQSKLRLSKYILIEYGAGKMASLQPEDGKAFLEELDLHLKKEEKSL